MRITIRGLEEQPDNVKEAILFRIFTNRYTLLGWIKGGLQVRQIEGRTRIYNAFRSPYDWNKAQIPNEQFRNMDWRTRNDMSEEQLLARREGVRQILQQSSFRSWIDSYANEVNFPTLANVVGWPMGGRLEIEVVLEGVQTN